MRATNAAKAGAISRTGSLVATKATIVLHYQCQVHQNPLHSIKYYIYLSYYSVKVVLIVAAPLPF